MKLIYKDKEKDIAIYHLSEELRERYANSYEAKPDIKINIGEKVFWFGDPNGLFVEKGEFTYKEGRIICRGKPGSDYERFYFVDNEIIQGDSGSPVFKESTGEIVGILANIFPNDIRLMKKYGLPPNKNYGLFIPITTFYSALQEHNKN